MSQTLYPLPLDNSAPAMPEAESSGRLPTNLAPPQLLQFWQIILRWKWVIAGIVTASVIAGLVVTLLITPQFTAEARI